jgi:acyl-CoA synthetase (AMP-forming)/AMP-acid ligase II
VTSLQTADPLGRAAANAPERAAIVMSNSLEVVSYGVLAQRSNRLARLFRAEGLRRGDVVALLMDNRPEFLEVAWAAQRSGLYYTAINWHLHPDEIAYILADSGAKLLVSSSGLEDSLDSLAGRLAGVTTVLCVGDALPGTAAYESALAQYDDRMIDDPAEGCELLYSSGTTGRPKAIKRPLPAPGEMVANHSGAREMYHHLYGADEDSVYLSPAPLYHSAPLMSCLTIHRLGGTVVLMDRFDPEAALNAIDRHRVTLGQFVPTMFIRMLKLAPEVRERYDLASLRCVIHASAPCPVWVKQDMIAWWGPILHEYYGGTEGMGTTRITSDEWLAHPGSVGRPGGCVIHILDEDGSELPTGKDGLVYFESERKFEYLNDPGKTASITDSHGWRTLGDVGHLDADGYLYLTDRATFMIVSGGVNIYPQEIEDALVGHPAVADAAVFGVPNPDMGEEVKAVIELAVGYAGSPALATELTDWCRSRLGRYKVPKTVEFLDRLPRDPNGKLYKKRLRAAYWPADRSL